MIWLREKRIASEQAALYGRGSTKSEPGAVATGQRLNAEGLPSKKHYLVRLKVPCEHLAGRYAPGSDFVLIY